MKIKTLHAGPALNVIIPVLLCAVSLSFFSCAGKKAEWTSPADAKELSLLENKTLETGLSKKQRAALFFLWGQELANAAQSGTVSEGTSVSEMNEKAIAAFEKVVDLDSVLVAESRFNLEILWKQQGQGGNGNDNSKENQDQGDKQNQQNQNGSQDKQGQQNQQDQKGSQDKQEQQNQQDQKGSQDKQGQQNQQGQQDKQDQQAQADQTADKNTGTEKDLSGLVRDKAGGKDLDDALKAEIDRKAAQQEAQAGGIRPVEKDW